MNKRENQHEFLGIDGMPNDRTIANLRGSGYQVKRTNAGFSAFHLSVVIGSHATEQGARFIAANHCHATAAKIKGYFKICPVDSVDGTTLSLVKSYRAKVKPGSQTREISFPEDDSEYSPQVKLSTGEYYVCHGETPLTHFHAKLRSIRVYKVGEKSGTFTVKIVKLGEDGLPQLARLMVQCDCGKNVRLAMRDFNPTYFRPKTQCPGCPAYQKILDRGSKVDEYGVIVDQFGLPENFGPSKVTPLPVVLAKPKRNVLDGMPHRDAPYPEWEAYHAKNDAKAAEKAARREAKARVHAEEQAVADANKWELGLDDENI